jgi:hypothetical protein
MELIRNSKCGSKSSATLPLMMKSSYPGLLLMIRAGYTVMTLRQSNIPSNGK